MRTLSIPNVWFNTCLTTLAPLIWGSTYIITTEFLPPDRPFIAAMIRALPAGLILVLFTRYLPKPQQWLRLLILSALNIAFFQAFLFVAAYRLPGGLAAVVGSIQPLLIMGLAWGIDRQLPAYLTIGASIFGIVGMSALLLSSTSVWDPIGITAAFFGAICMATGTYLTRRWQMKMPVLAFTGWQLLIGGLMLMPVALLIDPPLPALNLSQILGYGYLSLFGALLAYVLWFRGITRLSPVAVSSLGLLSPLTAVFLGWVLLKQGMTSLSLIGLFMVIASVLTVQWVTSQSR